MVDDLLELGLGDEAGQSAGDLVTVAGSFIKAQSVRDQEEAFLSEQDYRE